MYDYVDRPVSQLRDRDHFLVWAMRRWVHAAHDGQCPPSIIGPAFSRWRMLGALPHFHLAMILLNRQARGPIRFGPMPCPYVTEDEAVLLALVNAFIAGNNSCAHATVSLLVQEDAINGLVTCLTTLSTRLTRIDTSERRFTSKARPSTAARRGDSLRD